MADLKGAAPCPRCGSGVEWEQAKRSPEAPTQRQTSILYRCRECGHIWMTLRGHERYVGASEAERKRLKERFQRRDIPLGTEGSPVDWENIR